MKETVIFRKNDHGIVEAFFPDGPSRVGMIDGFVAVVDYIPSGKKSYHIFDDVSMDYYYNHTKPSTPDEFLPLLEELKDLFPETTWLIRHRINWKKHQVWSVYV